MADSPTMLYSAMVLLVAVTGAAVAVTAIVCFRLGWSCAKDVPPLAGISGKRPGFHWKNEAEESIVEEAEEAGLAAALSRQRGIVEDSMEKGLGPDQEE